MPQDESILDYEQFFDELLAAEAKTSGLNITILSNEGPDIQLSLNQEQVRQLTQDLLGYAQDKQPGIKPLVGQYSLLLEN